MPIILTILGLFLVALSDWMQPSQLRKPKMNIIMSSIGGIFWLGGIVLGFIDYSLLQAIGLLLASFIIGAIMGIKSGQ